MKENKLFAKLREDRGARAIAITITAMLLVLTLIIVTTVVANRRLAKTDDPPYSEPAGVTDPDDSEEEDGEADEEDKGPEDTQTDTLPTYFMLPVSGVMQKKHSTDVQVFSDTMRDYRMHPGIDIGTVAGATVSAMADGVVAQVWEDVSMGQCIAIAHSGDAYTIYKNLSAELPAGIVEGAAVKAGDTIGTVGDSAMVELAEEPHLHLEMMVGGLSVDPTEYLDSDAMASLGEDVNYEDAS